MDQTKYKHSAEVYEQYFVPSMFLPWSTILLRHAGLRLGERVLDVACGTGIVARQAALGVGTNGSVDAIDVNTAMLAVASAHPVSSGAAIKWHEGSAMALPFPDGVFNVVFCQHGLQFFSDRLQALREMRRVLTPDGRAVVIVLQKLGQHPVFEALMVSVAAQLSLPISDVTIPFVLHDTNELQKLFLDARFAQVDIIPESVTVSFPDPDRFVPLAVISSAAAIPAFALLEPPAKAALIETVRMETEQVVRRYRRGDSISFPMFANIAIGTP